MAGGEFSFESQIIKSRSGDSKVTFFGAGCDFLKSGSVSSYNQPNPQTILCGSEETLCRERFRRRANVPEFEAVYKDLQNRTQQLMLQLIENEINSAFIFAATARTAYRSAKFSEGNAALSKTKAIYAQARELARDGGVEMDQATAERISELRSAIDVLMRAKRGMDQ